MKNKADRVSKLRFPPGRCLFLAAFLFATTAEGSAAEIRFAIRLYGGLSYLSLAEMNDGIKGALNDIAFRRDIAAISTYNDLRMGAEFGADLVIFFTSKLGIAVGTEYIHGRKLSRYSFSGAQSGFISGEPIFTSVPVKASLFLKLPLSRKLNFTASAGVGYYHVSFDNTYAWEITGIVPQTTERFKFSAWRPGFQAGIGLEYALGSRLAVFFEASGRLARIKGLKGTVQFNQNTAESASLYSFEQIIETTWFPVLDAMPTAPAWEDIRNVREATIDLSGGSAIIGFVIKL